MSLEDTASMESRELPEVPGYRVIAPVGGGSRGTVFRARDLDTQELVALKVVDSRDAARLSSPKSSRLLYRVPGGSVKRALEDAAERLAGVECPVLVKPRKVLAFEAPVRLVVVMELVEGDSLARALGRSVRLVPQKAVRIAADVARGLGAAFDAGMVHGALHPAKIILPGESTRPGRSGPPDVRMTRPGRSGPADVPTARLLGAGLGETLPAEFATPAASRGVAPHVYAADEVLAGDPPSAASDVFSLGAILHHALTGHAPWNPSGLAALRVARADGPPVWPRGSGELTPAALMGLVDRMTSYDPAGRPAGGWMLAEALESTLKRSRRARRPVQPAIEAPPPDVAPVETGPDLAATPTAFGGLLERAREHLSRPSAIRVIVGGATAVFLLAVAMALRAPPAREASRRRPRAALADRGRTPREIDSASGAGEPVADADAAPADSEAGVKLAADPKLEEIRTIEGLLAENPGDVAVFRERLEALRSAPGEVGVRATLLLGRTRESDQRRAEDALRRLADRAAALEAGGRYGEALAALERFPFDRFAGTPAAERARLEADAVRGRAGAAFAEVERGAEPLLAAGRFAAARAEYEYLRDTVGLPVLVERAERALVRIGRMEEETAEAEALRRESEARVELAREVETALAEFPRLCGKFRYSKAERTLDGLLAQPLSGADRKRLTDYGEFVRREAALFRLVGERIRSGEQQGVVGPPGSAQRLAIEDVTEQGLELASRQGAGTLTTRLSWRRLEAYTEYKFMLEIGIGPEHQTSFDERIALAVFAYHRGLATEVDNELTVAKRLAQSRRSRELLARAREILRIDPFAE